MKQQINLYLPEFRPSHDYISGERLLQISVVVVLLMIIASGGNYFRSASLSSQMQVAQQGLDAQTAITNELQQDLARRSSDQDLVDELAVREQRLAESTEMLEFLRGTNLGNIEGFSEHVKDLSRATFDGLWLTEFDLLNGGRNVYLKGITQQSAMVPDFISRLSNGKSPLRDRNFSRFLGNRINTTPVEGLESVELYEFELETRK